MPRHEPIRVVVEKKGGGSGCGTAFGILLLIGLAIKYWYVALGIAVLVGVVGLMVNAQKRKQARRRPGPRDPWLNEVAVALSDLGLTERARNTGAQLGGAPLEGDIGVTEDKFSVFVNLLATDELARRAEIGLRAKPDIRTAMAEGRTAIKTVGRVVYVATGRGGVVDEFRFDEVVRAVDPIAMPPAYQAAAGAAPTPVVQPFEPSAAQIGATAPDALDHLRRLGELRAAGVLTDAEFEVKKAELLRRV